MPSSMIHLAAARLVKPDGCGLFLFGNIAPDYTDAWAFKDMIHLRDKPDRRAALEEMRDNTDFSKPFDEGWLLHLFTDALWDAECYTAFAKAHGSEENWFRTYRHEIGEASFWLYCNMPWMAELWERIDAAPLDEMRDLKTTLPVPLEMGWFRDRVRRKHTPAEGEIAEPSPAFPPEFTLAFAEDAAKLYLEWVNGG